MTFESGVVGCSYRARTARMCIGFQTSGDPMLAASNASRTSHRAMPKVSSLKVGGPRQQVWRPERRFGNKLDAGQFAQVTVLVVKVASLSLGMLLKCPPTLPSRRLPNRFKQGMHNALSSRVSLLRDMLTVGGASASAAHTRR